jgi:hypothetical protein
MSTNIFMATARLADAAAMAGFLAPIPNGAELAKLLGSPRPIASRAYDDETWTARFVASDAIYVKCFTVSDITIDQAEMIAAACPDISGLTLDEFRQAVEQALGPTLDADAQDDADE